jgi:tRNA (cytosine34-C5)-methyltransferase
MNLFMFEGKIPKFYENTLDGERKVMKFDRIVCDVPCSGDGTIRKNIDVWTKWNVSNGNNFNGIQTRIAKKALELLAKDGLMVYSTCSFNPMENEAVVSALLNEAEGAIELVPIGEKLQPLKFIPGLSKWSVMRKDLTMIDSYDQVEEVLRTQIRSNMFPPSNIDELHLDRCVRVLPHLQDTGGFFIALIRKTADKMPWEPEEKAEKVDGQESIKAEPAEEDSTTADEPPTKKICFARRSRGFKEDPFYFLKEDDQEWAEIKKYYGISDGFPFTQLMHRTEKINRNIYYLTSAAKQMINSNDSKVKVRSVIGSK